MHPPVELTPCRPACRDAIVDLWRASFAHGVGHPVQKTLDDRHGFEPVMQPGDLRHEWRRAGR